MKYHYCLLVLTFIISCSNTKNIPANSMSTSGFDTQGHRGSRGLMPENTFPAMKTALDLGVTTLEMDVVITKDKKVVLSHEPFFNHEISTKPDGSYVTEAEEKSLNIYAMDYDEVKKYDVGMKPHPRFPRQQKIKVVKPLLGDLIDSVQKYMMTSKRALPYFNIETKSSPSTDNIYHPAPAEFVESLMTVIEEKGIQERVIIQSFDFRTLQYLHKKYPSVKTAILIEDFDERGLKDQLKALGFLPTIYSPEYKMVTEELVKSCHEQNIKVIPWTVNDKTIIDRLKSLGVDGIISDYPNLFND
ncbi:MAG TPA: glycerophosphodiester phosphodiesterase [Chitinophagaceae bacterium]|nr:glycerophosphodiester phosphodiesterase [Chitinophagaceae bacterium]